jgi:hypothetical protein
MAASSGFQGSPGHAASGASARPLKWATTEVHFDVIVDFVIDHNHSYITCYSQYKLKMRRRLIHYNMISLIVYYGPLPMTMDAVLATIVASGRAQIQLNIRSIQIYYFLH